MNSNNRLPSVNNYTWGTAAWGTDTITIQATDALLHCTPDPTTTGCIYSIAVYGWRNSSYTITATLDEGWLNPIRLLDGQPQTGSVLQGEFRYYKFVINQDVLSDITFTLNPTDGGDQVCILSKIVASSSSSSSSSDSASITGSVHHI